MARIEPFRVRQSAYIGWAKADPLLGWRNNPGVHRADEPPHEPMTFLPDGSRATGTPAGASGAPVLIVGCSFAEGYGVRDDQTFAWLLQRRFPTRPILNFGTPGYSTYQTLLLLEELTGPRGIHPSAVIYGFIPMHAERNVLTSTMLEAYRGFGGQRFSPPHVEAAAGRLETFPPFVVPDWPFEGRSALMTLLHRSALRAMLAKREQTEEEATRLLIVRMKRLADSLHAPFLVATLWDGGPPGPESYRRMSASMRASGVAEINVTYAGPEKDPARLHVGGVGHPGPVVHEWWAEHVAEWLSSATPQNDTLERKR